jgi:hypothetical protein
MGHLHKSSVRKCLVVYFPEILWRSDVGKRGAVDELHFDHVFPPRKTGRAFDRSAQLLESAPFGEMRLVMP